VVADVKGWLARSENSDWLLVFDNVDREYDSNTADPPAYDIEKYYPQVDHGSILITTRLASLEQLGESRLVTKVDKTQALAILQSWYKIRDGMCLTCYSIHRTSIPPLSKSAYIPCRNRVLTLYL
jgi:hypothetical protein